MNYETSQAAPGGEAAARHNSSFITLNSPTDLRDRTKSFALRIVKMFTALPKTAEAQVLGKQALRSGTSVGAQYREGKRAKSDADLVSKLEGALQELEESEYWLELLEEAAVFSNSRLQPLLAETPELISIFVTVVKNIKDR